MGATGTKSSEINERDNVYDIVDLTKDNLKALKSDLDFSQEVGFDADLKQLNDNIDRFFNGFLDPNRKDWNSSITLDTGKTATVKSIVMSGNKTDMDALTRYILKESRFLETLDQFETEEVRKTIQQFSFEIKQLKQTISSSEDTSSTPTYDANAFLANQPETGASSSETSERTYKNPNHYVQPYENSSYAQIDSSQHIENIYKDTNVRKVLERIFDKEENEELRRGTFAVNLSIEDGLGGIIIAIRDALQMGRSPSPDENSKAYQLYTTLLDGNMMNLDDGIVDLSFELKDIKKLIKTDGLLTYKSKYLGDLIKITKILTRAKREDLDTFASLLQSKPNIAMAVKEWNNALEMTGNSRDDKEGYTSSLITGENVLDFLCDFNSDGNLSAVYKKNNYKEQKNQGDVGNLFGQQVEFTIEQAIRVKSVELNSTSKGEQFVISNIIKNMHISDSRNLTQPQKKLLSKMQADSTACTKENLALLVNGNGDDMPAMPEMKIFFLDSIKKINGGSQATTPDLYDTLVGKDAEYIVSLNMEQDEKKLKLKKVLDYILVKSEDPGIKAEIEKNGLVRVRETLFIKIMTVLDHVEITGADNPSTQLQSPGIDKGRIIQETKNELLDKIIQSLITTGIHYSTTGGLRLMLGYGKEGISGRTKRSRGAGAGVILQADALEIAINISGDVAEQYNHNQVINADLSKVASARYVGIEGGALAGINPVDRGVAAEAYAGLNRQQDPLTGINQLDKQYTRVSEEIFTLTELPDNVLESKETFGKYLYKKINDHTTDSVYGDFVANNKQHLRANADFIVRYMEANNLFGPTGLLNDKSQTQQKDAITSLISILQTGNQELRRHDIIASLHGKVALTKLSFGVTTNALTIKFSSSTPPAPPATGVDGYPAGTPQGTSTDRFGFYGFYVGTRISTWKNTYVPNVAPYLFTQYEMETGRDTQHVEHLDTLDAYAAYLQALYNDDKRLSCTVSNGKLVITFTPDESSPNKDKKSPAERMTLQKYLNLYATEESKTYFSLEGNTLTIGNVGDIGAYTATEAKGVRRILCLGTKELGKARRVRENTGTENPVEPITFKEVGTRERTKPALTKEIIPHMQGTGSTLETVKTETAAFFDAKGALIAPPKTKVIFTPSSIEGTTISTGTLTILKHSDGSYTVTLDTTQPHDQLTLNYNAYLPGQTEQPTTLSSSTDKLFTFEGTLYQAQSELTMLSKFLIELEDKNRTAYASFLKAASTAEASDGTIDTDELTQAIIHLEKLLGTNKKFVKIIGFLKSDNRSVKSYVIDRFKQILAREYAYYTKKVGKILEQHMNGETHWNALVGPSTLPLSPALQEEMIAARQSLKDTYGNVAYTNTDTTHVAPNLIGYTAFYRPKEQTYSLTSLGDTSYIGELKTLTPALAQEWFLANFKTNKHEVELLATTLEAQLLKQGITLTLKKSNYTETFSTIESLLKGDSLPIDSGKEISIDLKWVFYLLGDCCNESLGMEITKIHITSKSAPAASYTATATPEKQREGGIDLWNKSHSVSSHVRTTEKKVSLKYHHALQEETPPPPKPTDPDPELPPAPDPTIPDPTVPGPTLPE